MIRLGFMILINDDCNDVRMAWKILLHDVIPLSVVLYPPVRHDKTQPTLGISTKNLPPIRQREIGFRSKLRADCLWKTGIRCRCADMCRFE